LGGQVDHLLAAMTVLVRYPDRRVMMVGDEDILTHLPPSLDLPLAKNTRVSLYPMREVEGASQGLHWPVDGLLMSPSTRGGTSNRAEGSVSLRMKDYGMLLILPLSTRAVLQRALLRSDDSWPAL
ncbi:MAG TPA: thiamine pyrophosphokinase, partial [Marivita sp.]|nr:thiamine pyrophosphokinase [Marivita sp.]